MAGIVKLSSKQMLFNKKQKRINLIRYFIISAKVIDSFQMLRLR